MTAPDVKVTLTADDEATEVVRRLSAAVKQLGLDQRSANQNAANSASAATSAFGDLQHAVEGVLAALGALKLLDLAKQAIETADQIGNLAQKTGVSAETLSALAVAAAGADVSTEELNNGLKFLSRSTSELEAGSVKASAAFRALGLSAEDLKGLSLDQVLIKVADAQQKFGDGAGKTAALMQIFGRSGEELIPLLHELANGGFDEVQKKAASLGAVITGQGVKASKDFTIAMADLQAAFRGATLQLAPLIEGFSKFVEEVAKFVGQHPDLVGFGITAAAAAIAVTGLAAAVTVLSGAMATLAAVIAPLDIAILVIFGLLVGFQAVKSAIQQATDEVKKFGAAATQAAGKGGGLPQVQLTDPALEAALRQARIAAAQQQAKSELAIADAKNKQQEQLDSAAFAQGLSSLAEFFAQRRAIVQSSVAGEIASLDAERTALQQQLTAPGLTPADELRIRTQIKGVETQIATTKIAGQTQLNALVEEERTKRLSLLSELRSFNEQISKAQGDQVGADQAAIEAQVERFRLALAQVDGETQDSIDAQSAAFQSLLTDRAAFDEEQRQAQRALVDLGLERDKIQQRIDTGQISEFDGQKQILALEQQRLPQLQQIAQAMAFFADRTKDPALQEAAKQFATQIAAVGTELTAADQKLRDVGKTLSDTLESDLSTFLGTTINQVHGIGDALLQLGTAIVSSVQRVLADVIASQAVQAIRGLFSGAQQATPLIAGAAALTGASTALDASGATLITAAAALGAAALALAASTGGGLAALLVTFGIAGLAGGGLVSGPGSGTSDSILARLSAGEFVVPAASVRQPGVLAMLEALRGGTPRLRSFSSGVPGFASGGLVDGGSDSGSGSFEGTIGLEEGLVFKHLGTRGGLKALLDVVGANPQAFKVRLGVA